MAELTFFYGTMNCGKSTLALQIHHNHTQAGEHGLLFTRFERDGGVISSRIGLAQPATVVTDDLDFREYVGALVASGTAVDFLICDEAQFYSACQVEQLARVVDELAIDVFAFGLLADFTSELFDGSKRLLELADRRQEMQVEALCWCGARGSHNARTVNGDIVYEGEQVVVGDVALPGEAPHVAYEVLCRRHYREGVTRSTADRLPVHSSRA